MTLQYKSPGGDLGDAVAKWFGSDPNTKIAKDLQRFKEEMETGVFSQAGTENSARCAVRLSVWSVTDAALRGVLQLLALKSTFHRLKEDLSSKRHLVR